MKRTFLWAALLLNGTAPALACTGILHGPGRGLRHGTHDRMGREPAAQRLCRHSPAARNRLIHAYRSQRFVVPRKIRGGRTDDRPGRIHRRGNQRSRTVGRTVLLPPLRQIPGLRFDPERPDALGSPVCRVDTLAILLRRRSQSRHTDRTGRIDRSLRRLDRAASRSCWSSSTASPASTTTKSAC